MRKIFAALAFFTLILVSGHAIGLSLDLRGPTFQEGHPLQGESLLSAMSPGEVDALDTSVEILKRYPEVLIDISGHAD
jgi:hypothetical protein